MKTKLILTAICLTASTAALVSAENAVVPYPDDYRNWKHVKSMLIQPGHELENPFQGIHHVYANDKALSGLQTGQYADGAVLAFDLLEYTEADKTIQEGKRKLLGVMHKNSSQFSRTGGWGFEGFAGDSKTERLTNDGGQSCYGCHMPQKDKDYVFSQIRP